MLSLPFRFRKDFDMDKIDWSIEFSYIASGAGIIGLLTLIVLEIVLGIDNIIFISIVANRLDKSRRPRARFIGLVLALVMRIILLCGISWLASLTKPLIEVFGHGFSGRELILLAGGIFLLIKTTSEIHQKLEGAEEGEMKARGVSMASIIFQIVLIDIIFSFDSILTAVGLMSGHRHEVSGVVEQPHILVMILAVIVSMIIMMLFSGSVAEFIDRHPTIKMLALAFLLMIGVLLVMEGFGQEIDKKYVYVSMAFAFGVELLNMRMRRNEARRGSETLTEEDDPQE